MASYWTTLGFVLVAMTMVATLVCYVAPHWLATHQPEDRFEEARVGLWARCQQQDGRGEECAWIFQENSNNFSLPDWLTFCQVVYSLGAFLTLFSFILSSIHICCRCCRYVYLAKVITATLLAAFVFSAVAISICVWNTSATPRARLEWAFWVGGLALCFNILSAFTYYFIGFCKPKPNDVY